MGAHSCSGKPKNVGTFPNMKKKKMVFELYDIAEELGGIAAQARFGDLEGAKLHWALKEQAHHIEAVAWRLGHGEP